MEFFSFQSGQTEDESGWGDDSDSDEEERQQTSHGSSTHSRCLREGSLQLFRFQAGQTGDDAHAKFRRGGGKKMTEEIKASNEEW